MADKKVPPKTVKATSVPPAKKRYTPPHEEVRSAQTQAAADQFLGEQPPAETGGR